MNKKDRLKEIGKINKEELLKAFEKYNGGCKCNCEKNNRYFLTLQSGCVFFRLYVTKNIQVFIRTNTLNSREESKYDFVIAEDLDIEDLKKYRNDIKEFYKNILKEAEYTYYIPEDHKEMIPSNATDEEKANGWYKIYESRLLEILDYNNDRENFYNWIKKFKKVYTFIITSVIITKVI